MADFEDFGTQQAGIDRRRKIAEMLMQQGMTQDQGQMVSGHYVAPSNMGMIAKLAQSLIGNSNMGALDKEQAALKTRVNEDRIGSIQRYADLLQGREAVPAKTEESAPPSEDFTGPGVPNIISPAQQGVAPNRRGAVMELLRSQDPSLQQFGMQQMLKEPTVDKPIVLGRTLVNPITGKTIATDATWADEQRIAREAKAEELKQKLADAAVSRAEKIEAQKELAKLSADNRMAIAQLAGSLRQPPAPSLTTIVDPNNPNKSIVVDARTMQKIGESPGKPKAVIPTSALKMQQEELEAIGTAATIDADIGAVRKQIESGKLNLGVVNNAVGTARNFVGLSSEESRNLSSFKATMEKQRNDSLRLNKGTQTEGDAVRAWNELFSNINDPKVVDQRLAEIQQINKRAANLRKMNVDSIRANYGADPLDTTPYANQPAAVGKQSSGATSGLPGGWTVTEKK